MHNRKSFLVFFVLILALTLPLAASGAKEVILSEYEAELAAASSVPSYAEVDKTSVEESFSYAYGYMITSSLKSQGVSFNGGYWLRGIQDGIDYFTATPLISTDDMNTVVTDYIDNYYGAGLTGEVGTLLTSDEISALASPAEDDLLSRFSYCYGFIYAVQLYWMNGYEITAPTFQQGAAEALYLEEPVTMTSDEMTEAVNAYAEKLNAEYEAYVAQITEENLAAAEEFLEQNKDNEGVVTLPSGDLIEIISEDETLGARPAETDSVIVDYDLYLLDGTQVDSGTDVTFSLESLIPGFVEACLNMNVGQECYVYIHPDYGYGESGTSSIEPNSLLIFRIYLKGIAEAEAAETAETAETVAEN